MKTIQKNKVLILLLCMYMGLMQSCKKEVILKTSKEITVVDFANVSNEVLKVDEAKGIVWVNVPWQNGWNLKAFISHTGVKIEPTDTQIRDYTRPVTFTVTAEDGSTKNYTLIVTSAKASINFSSTVSRTQDQDFHKYLQAKTTSETYVGAGKTFLIISVGTVIEAGRNNNFGYDIYVPSSGLINGQPYFLGNFNVSTTVGFTRVITYLNSITGVSELNPNTTFSFGCWADSSPITINNYDITNKVVSGICPNLILRNLNSGQFYNGNCSFQNVPVQ
jgi:hypothetical protein